MSRVKGKDTTPELAVRRMCRAIGRGGYRLHRRDLPGKPDIAYIGRKAAIFVHGCFWHGHNCPAGSKIPKTNTAYWVHKIERNKQRDTEHLTALKSKGWRILIIWECEIRNEKSLKARLTRFLSR